MPSAEKPLTRSALSRIGCAVLDLVYPQDCIACGREVPVDRYCLCADCAAALPRIGQWQCPRCGDELGPYSTDRDACPSCSSRRSLMFHSAIAACRYEDPARIIVHRLKYGGDTRAARLMVDAMVGKLRGCKWIDEVDVVAPVPLHWTRRLQRRYNQSELLTQPVSAALRKRHVPRLLRRARRTTPQSLLDSEAQRAENVRGAFAARKPREAEGRTILLVDDVMTTCSTITECTRALLNAGARRVYVAVFAR